jgi:hypothetical protein
VRFITQEALDNAVIFRLFVFSQSSGERLAAREICNLFSINVSERRIELALSNLDSQGYISRRSDAKRSCVINSDGYRFVEEQILEESSIISRYAKLGDQWLSEQTLPVASIPASDRIVTRHDNQGILSELELGLDQIVAEIEKDNEVGAALGDERDLLIAEAEASKTLISRSAFRLARLVGLLVPALKYIADKFAGAAIGQAAKNLIELLMRLS